jgi:phosphoribosylglycinamide formyltransferase-1
MKRIAIFASGSGTNAEKIINYFQDSDLARVIEIFTNNKNAGVIERARKYGISCFIVNDEQLSGGDVLKKLREARIDLVVLAGFLRKIPAEIVETFESRIINIHPALLPDYGGPGMYGMHVHQAVVENEEEETGITIHYVNNDYDEGEIIFQETVEIDPEDSPEDVAYKVQQLEHKHYPEVIEWLLNQMD